jgi:hypothetical protein
LLREVTGLLSLSEEETFDRYTGEEVDELVLEEDFTEDEVWE